MDGWTDQLSSTMPRSSLVTLLLIARGACAGRTSFMPFVEGDVWRGFLSSCHQSAVHNERQFRTFPFDLTVARLSDRGIVHATFTSHYDKTECVPRRPLQP